MNACMPCAAFACNALALLLLYRVKSVYGLLDIY